MKTTALQRWRKPNSKAVEKLCELLRAYLFLQPVIWFLQLYDDHWTHRFRLEPDIHNLTRLARGENPLHAPIPLPRKRKRALTNPLPPIERSRDLSYSVRYSVRRARQRTEEQGKCLFLERLPIELRELVYEEVLAGGGRKLVHILRKRGRLGHWRCRIQDGDETCGEQSQKCVEGWLEYKRKLWHWDKQGRVDLRTDAGLLNLILTCRSVYSEAIPILYSKNIFHFYDPGDIRHFSRSVLPQRLNAVHSILIDWERAFSIFNRDNRGPKFGLEELKLWCETWAIIGKMEGLTEITVLLKTHQFEVPKERRIKMCRPMMEIRGLKTYELVVPWDDTMDWGFAEKVPFRIVRGVKPEERVDIL